jgi:hypothetical protein
MIIRSTEQRIRVVSEALAREVNRRTFLKRAGGAVVAGVVALVMAPALGGRDNNAAAAPRLPNVANCVPPGPYCNLDGQNEPNGCKGASCFQHFSAGQVVQCTPQYGYQTTGCWTTIDGNGYWTCCDCDCTNGSSCGCAQYTYGPGVFPD